MDFIEAHNTLFLVQSYTLGDKLQQVTLNFTNHTVLHLFHLSLTPSLVVLTQWLMNTVDHTKSFYG